MMMQAPGHHKDTLVPSVEMVGVLKKLHVRTDTRRPRVIMMPPAWCLISGRLSAS